MLPANFKTRYNRLFAVEKKTVYTSSGIERTYTIWRFARWSYSIQIWRAG